MSSVQSVFDIPGDIGLRLSIRKTTVQRLVVYLASVAEAIGANRE